MSAAKHTPGPWSVSIIRAGTAIVDSRGVTVGAAHQLGRAGYPDETEANARLIAAAPSMLEALEGIEHFSDALNYRDDLLSNELRKWINQGRAVIAKATAETGDVDWSIAERGVVA